MLYAVMKIYTIGHSNHKWETFLSLLKAHGIQTLVDVRTKPVSRYARFANKHKMPELLNQEGIEYVFMGDTLGGKPDDPTLYDNKGKPDYRAMASKLDFLDGIDSLISLAENNTLGVELPIFVELEVVQTDPGVRGDTASGGTKPASLETGATIQVPLFIEAGNVLKVDTRTDSYVERV